MAKRFIDFYRDAVLNKGSGGGSEPTLIDKNITSNNTYNASDDSADGYKKVVVNVPNSYSAGDEGKVVVEGELVAQGSDTFYSNDTYDTTKLSEVTVDVQPNVGQGMFDHDGTYYATDAGLDGYDVVEVNTGGGGGGSTLVPLYEAISTDGAYTFDPSDYSADGFDSVTIDVLTGGGGGGNYEVFQGSFTAQAGTNAVQFDSQPSGSLVGYMVGAVDGSSVNATYKVGYCCAFDSKDNSGYPIKVASVGRASSTSNWAGQMGAMQAFPEIPSQMGVSVTLLTALEYDSSNHVLKYIGASGAGSNNNYRLLAGVTYNYVAVFDKSV